MSTPEEREAAERQGEPEYITYIIGASTGRQYEVDVIETDLDPQRHALVMLRMMLVREGPIPELEIIGRIRR